MSRAKDIAVRLGGQGVMQAGGRYWCRCPVHGDATTLSMTVKDDRSRRDGIDVRCWSVGCDWQAIKAALVNFNLLDGVPGRPTSLKPIDPKVIERERAEQRKQQAKRRDLARWLWTRATPGAESAEIARYLGGARRIDLARIGGVPDCLRHETDARIPETDPPCHGPAMVAAVTDVLGDVTALHQTFLNWSGSAKASMTNAKFIIGPPGGGAVRLFAIPADGVLGVAEGIETALSAAELHGIPTWAVLNTSGMMGFMAPAGITRVVIFADFDGIKANGKRPGSHAAEALAARLQQHGISARIRYPADGQNDFNDELTARKRLAVAS